MTDAEATAIYLYAFGRPDPIAEGHLELTRQVVAADDLATATAILRKAGWYYPDGHAMVLREAAERIRNGEGPA